MTTETIAGVAVDRNEEGFFTDATQWTEEMAPELAKAEGIDELTPDHWTVIRFMRSEYFDKGTGPTVRMLGKTSGVSVKELAEFLGHEDPGFTLRTYTHLMPSSHQRARLAVDGVFKPRKTPSPRTA